MSTRRAVTLPLALGTLTLAGAFGLGALFERAPPEPATATKARLQRESPVESAFWEWRVSYPTGRFTSGWYEAARVEDQRIERRVPDVERGQAKGYVGLLDPSTATELGPAPLNWGTEAAYGRVGGRVNVIVNHPTDPTIAWFGSDGGGVWKTTNCCSSGTTWVPKTELPTLGNIAIGALALEPGNPNVIYAGTGDFRRNRPFTFGAGGLLKSSDGGDSWSVLGADVFNPVYTQPAGQFPQYRAMSAIAIDPNATLRIAVGTNQGLYLTIDGGANWSGPCFTNGFSTQRQDITGLFAIDLGATTELVAAVGALGRNSTVRTDLNRNGANGVYRAAMPLSASCPVGWSLISRSDNGWPANSGSGLPFGTPGGNPLRRIDIAVAPSDTNVIYAQVENLGVWRSVDGGGAWTQRGVQPADFSTGCVTDSFSNGMLFQNYNAGMIVSPTDPNVVFLSTTDVWRSFDGADTFTNLTCGYDETAPGVPGIVHVDNHARAIVGGDAQRLIAGNDGGLNYSSNALAVTPSFIGLNGGARTIEFYSGDISPRFDDPAVATRAITGGAQDNGCSNVLWGVGITPAATEWTVRQGGDGVQAMIEPILQQRWYYSAQFGYIGASTSGPTGAASTLISPDDDWAGDRRGFLMPYTLYRFGDASTCSLTNGCLRMLAGTFRVWESVSGGIPNTSWYSNSPDLTKALALNNDLSIINKVEHAPSDASVAIAGTNDGNVWYGFSLGLGTANSASWVNVTAANAVLPNRPVMDVTIHPTLPLIAYAGLSGFDQNTPATPGHVYRLACSANCTAFTWSNKSGNLPNIPVNAVMVNPRRPHQVYAGTDWGLYYTDDIEAPSPVWFRFGNGLPPAMIWDLVVDRGATTLAIYTRSRGAWVYPLPGASGLLFADGFETE